VAEQDWKTKYLDLTRKQEETAAASEETEQQLCRAIVRLALATSGLDPQLDPHLNKLRDLVRKGPKKVRDFNDKISSASEALVRAHDDDQTPSTSKAVEPSGDGLFQRLLDRTQLTGRDAGRLKRIGRELQAEPESASDEKLDELLELLARGISDGKAPVAETETETEEGGGLLGRLFGREKGHGDQPLRRLLGLLAGLNWPAQFKQDITAMESRLKESADDSVVEAVVGDLSKIVSAVLGDLESEMKATENFLTDLTNRLKELDKFVLDGHALQRASLQSGRDLNQVVSKNVGHIENSVKGADDMQVLQRDLAGYIDTIRVHMDQHLKTAEKRFEIAQKNEKNLRQKLLEAEQETGALRQKIVEVHAHSTMDAVTGLPNRKAYEERLAEEYSRWQRYQNPLVMSVWDLDDFKKINDRFGHQAGDKALFAVGQMLKQRLRKTDYVARYGGEEFVMLFTGSHMKEVLEVAEVIRAAVEKSRFHTEGKPVKVTISCGLSEFAGEDTPETVFKRADKALYKAKGEGKNRCIVAPAPDAEAE
jgi:diguanylate cyclase